MRVYYIDQWKFYRARQFSPGQFPAIASSDLRDLCPILVCVVLPGQRIEVPRPDLHWNPAGKFLVKLFLELLRYRLDLREAKRLNSII